MEKFIIPKDYHSELNLHDTQIAIKTVKDFFQNLLSQRLNLSRVSAPLFVDPDSGLNDNWNALLHLISKNRTEGKLKLSSPLQNGKDML